MFNRVLFAILDLLHSTMVGIVNFLGAVIVLSIFAVIVITVRVLLAGDLEVLTGLPRIRPY